MKKLFEKYRELIIYVIVGGLTTLVNYVIHFGLRAFNVNYYVALTVAWFGAVVFAYVANRIFVFESKSKGKEQFKEITLFFGARVFSYGLEMLISFIFIDCAKADRFVWQPEFTETVIPVGELIVKTVSQIIILVSNFIFSKFVIFKKDE